MKREEAIIELKRKITCTIGGLSKEEYNATVMAIEALQADAEQEAVPTVVRVTMSDGKQYYLEHERDAIHADAVQGFRGGKIPPKEMLDGTVLIPKHQWLEMERELAELKEKFESTDAVSIHEDGTLEVKVPNAHKVGRVLVKDADSHIGGGLFYPDREDGE